MARVTARTTGSASATKPNRPVADPVTLTDAPLAGEPVAVDGESRDCRDGSAVPLAGAPLTGAPVAGAPLTGAPVAGEPVAVVGADPRGGPGGVASPAAAVRDALLAAGAAVAGIAPRTPVPAGTRWVVDVVDLTGPPTAGRDGGGGEPGLGPDSVIVVLGDEATAGGRSIGARAAVALARAFGCGVELVGLPDPADDACHLARRGAAAAPVGQAILGRGELGRPGEIAVEHDRTLAAREVRQTLADLSEHAAFAGFRALHPRDAAALAAAIDDVRARRGRLAGVVRVADAAPGGGAGRPAVRPAVPSEVA